LGRAKSVGPVESPDDQEIPPPPDLPAQGIGPHFQINADGRIDLAPPDALDRDGNHLPTLRSLHPDLRELATSLAGRLPTGNNTHPLLGDRIAAYRALIDQNLDQIDFRRLYLAGVRLTNGLRATDLAIVAGEVPTLNAEIREEVDSLLQAHGPFLLATAAGAEILVAEERYDRPLEEELAGRVAAEELVQSFSDSPEIITPAAQESLANAVAESGQGPHPIRSALHARSTVRNVTITALGGATFVAMPLVGGALLTGTAGMIAGGLLGWAGLKGLEKSDPGQHALEMLGRGFNVLAKADIRAALATLRVRMRPLRDFVRSTGPKLRRLLGTLESSSWLDRSLDWIEEQSAQTAHDPSVTGKTVTLDQSDKVHASAIAGPPFDYSEEEAERLILAGSAPPLSWRPFITKLSLGSRKIRESGEIVIRTQGFQTHINMELLSSLSNLELLSLRGMQVKDITSLAGLPNLTDLDLRATNVSDLAPLTRIGHPQIIEIFTADHTNVDDPLQVHGFASSLRVLDVALTPVRNFDFISELDGLTELYLTGTSISDLGPLAGLSALRHLALDGTNVSDLAPLARLTALEHLDLADTQISDLKPIAKLNKLQRLGLNGSMVSDLSPIAGLTKLHGLDLRDTRVSNLTPISDLTELQRLGLAGTRVSDIGPLAGMKGLRILLLDGTDVKDLSPVRHIDGLSISGP